MKAPVLLRPPARSGWLLASGLLLGLAHPPFHLLLPSFVALVPFAAWLRRLPPGEEGRSAALRGGFLLGLVYFSLVFYWLVVALIFYTWLAVLAFLAPLVILALFLSLATLAMHLARIRLGWPVWVGLPVFWTAMEWVRGHLGEVAFPWMGLGDTLSGFPWLIGSADIVGSRGLTFWLALFNGLLAEMVPTPESAPAPETGPGGGAGRARAEGSEGAPRRRLRLALAAAATLAIPLAYSLVRWTTLEMRPAARVAVIQPNIAEDLKLDREVAVDSARVSVERLVSAHLVASDSDLDLLILPETVLPVLVDPIPSRSYTGRPELHAWVGALARRLDAGVLFGAIGSRDLGGGEYEYYNSALLVDRAGKRAGSYHKRYLVPVVERVPFVDPRWFRGLEYFGGFGVGRSPQLLEVDGLRFGALVCYESIFADLSRRHRRGGADFLVNITNDAWFGRAEPWWSRSNALWQHPAHLVMRAIENRVGIARSANTGISGVVDPLGRMHHGTELFTPDAFVTEVLTTDGRTVYSRAGDVVGWVAAFVAAVAIAAIGLGKAGRRAR
ncbi:MAG: apolipoprotein N-acyltransferase [Gemmatimonadota bacterium]